MPRLFVGTYVASREAKRIHASTGSFIQALGQSRPSVRVRATGEKKLHLTWAFLGDVDEALAMPHSPLCLDIDRLAKNVPATSLTFDDFEVWQGVLVLTAGSAETQSFIARVEAVRQKLKIYSPSLTAEKRPFTPHITIARFNGQLFKDQVREEMETLIPVNMEVESVSLIESMAQGGYRPVITVPLN